MQRKNTQLKKRDEIVVNGNVESTPFDRKSQIVDEVKADIQPPV